MADLLAIGYPDAETAAAAAEEARRLATDLVIDAGAIVAITRGGDGAIRAGGLDSEFVEDLRELLQPGTSALFVVVGKVTPDKVVEGLAPFGGTVLKTSLDRAAADA